MSTSKNNTKQKSVNFVNIPQELKANAAFCLWKKERRNNKLTKVPYDPKTGKHAKTNDPSTFTDFNTTMTTYAMGGWNGIGYRVSEGIGAIDIDHCIREDGTLNDIAASILSLLPDTYFEKSPSGTGLRGFFRLSPDFAYDKTMYYINNRKLGLEVYLPGTTNRFVTVTGDVYRPGIVSRNDEALQSVLDKFMKRRSQAGPGFQGTPVSYFTDEQVIEHASASKQGELFKTLYEGNWEGYYPNHSDADMALISMLTFWCGGVEEQIDRIFRSSGMMRDKWDRETGGSTYGAISIRNALATCTGIYRPSAGDLSDFKDLDMEKIQEERDRRESEGYSSTPDYRYLDTTIEAMAPHTNPYYESFQIGNSRMFVDYYRKIILMNETRGCWYIYDGCVWRPDPHKLKIAEMAKHFHDQLLAFSNSITSEDTRNRFLKRVDLLDQKKYRDTMIKDSGGDPSITVLMSAFDRDKYVFNCHNGTYHLITGEFTPHNPSDFLTKMTEVDYNPEATCPRWLTFLDEVMEGDTDRIRYLQKIVGYALSGDTRYECMFLLYGPSSRNGKGTTMETILRILGEYGRTAQPDMLGKKNYTNSSGPSEDVARLNGARLVNVSEPEKNMQIDASLAKLMTGNNNLAARFLRENSFEFKPQFKLFVDTNHLPRTSDMTLFDSDRIVVIPFYRHFREEERDIDLKSFFAKPENLSGILNWCLEGFRLYWEEGLRERPESVREATRKYREQSDRISMFTTQCVKKEIGSELRAKAVYTRYKEWCAENGYKYENAGNFRKKMEMAGYVYHRRRPWNETKTEKTTMINNITWVNGEELEEDLISEFESLEPKSAE